MSIFDRVTESQLNVVLGLGTKGWLQSYARGDCDLHVREAIQKGLEDISVPALELMRKILEARLKSKYPGPFGWCFERSLGVPEKALSLIDARLNENSAAA